MSDNVSMEKLDAEIEKRAQAKLQKDYDQLCAALMPVGSLADVLVSKPKLAHDVQYIDDHIQGEEERHFPGDEAYRESLQGVAEAYLDAAVAEMGHLMDIVSSDVLPRADVEYPPGPPSDLDRQVDPNMGCPIGPVCNDGPPGISEGPSEEEKLLNEES